MNGEHADCRVFSKRRKTIGHNRSIKTATLSASLLLSKQSSVSYIQCVSALFDHPFPLLYIIAALEMRTITRDKLLTPGECEAVPTSAPTRCVDPEPKRHSCLSRSTGTSQVGKDSRSATNRPLSDPKVVSLFDVLSRLASYWPSFQIEDLYHAFGSRSPGAEVRTQ